VDVTDFRLGFCVSGEGRLARAAIANAARLGVIPALLLADHRASRDLETFCAAHGTPVVRLEKGPRAAFDARVTEACIAARLDLVALTFEWLLAPQLVAHYRGRIINVHPALLPAFPGMNALGAAVRSGVRYVGASIHEVDDGMDTGPLIAQCVLALRRSETEGQAGARMFELLRPMFLQVIRWHVEGRVERDSEGRIFVRDAVYGEFPISPTVEANFPD
jgi:phosphoribosylglycinamide formyltransferase-1